MVIVSFAHKSSHLTRTLIFFLAYSPHCDLEDGAGIHNHITLTAKKGACQISSYFNPGARILLPTLYASNPAPGENQEDEPSPAKSHSDGDKPEETKSGANGERTTPTWLSNVVHTVAQFY